MKDLGLLNYEGDVLKINRDSHLFPVYDQWNNLVDMLSRDKLFIFLEGKCNITDSTGKEWNWLKEHVDSRASLKSIYEYIK